jgi:hypothetical protein
MKEKSKKMLVFIFLEVLIFICLIQKVVIAAVLFGLLTMWYEEEIDKSDHVPRQIMRG